MAEAVFASFWQIRRLRITTCPLRFSVPSPSLLNCHLNCPRHCPQNCYFDCWLSYARNSKNNIDALRNDWGAYMLICVSNDFYSALPYRVFHLNMINLEDPDGQLTANNFQKKVAAHLGGWDI